MARDPETIAHQEWIGYVQPVGLVVSIPSLLAAQAHVNRNIAPQQQKLLACLPRDAHDEPVPQICDFPRFAQEVLGWEPGDLVAVDCDDAQTAPLVVALPAYHDTLRPTYAVKEVDPKDGKPWLMLVEAIPAGADFDKIATEDSRQWQATPHHRFERLLRETEVPIGLLVNGTHLRLVYAPRGETSGYATFPVAHMIQVAGRPIFAALHMLLCAERVFGFGLANPDKQCLASILAESRKYQNVVSTQLAEQVLAALYDLVRGFQAADDQRHGELLREVLADDPNHVYAGLLTVLMRLVFVLYAEDRGLLSNDPVYGNFYSVTGLFDRLRADAGRYPDTMDQRYGAWAQLLTLFRLVYEGGSHADLHIPAREGYLFDPNRFNFLEGRPHRIRRAQAEARPEGSPPIPNVSDGVIFRVLNNLLIVDGERLSYRTLDVEQIGSVYETMMGFNLRVAEGRSIAIKPTKSHGAPATINLEALLATKPADRAKWLTAETDQKVTGQTLEALKKAGTLDELLAALDKKIAGHATPSVAPKGAMVLQPSDERRRSGSHYTPRSLTEPIVRTTLRPVLERLKEGSREWGVGSRGEKDSPASASPIPDSLFPTPSSAAPTPSSTNRRKEDGKDRVVSGSGGVAIGNQVGEGRISADEAVSTGGTVRADQPDPSGGHFDPSEHCGGERPGEHGGVHPVLANRPGKPQGIGDASDSVARGRDLPGASDPAAIAAGRGTGPDAEGADSHAAAEAGARRVEEGNREWGVGSRGEKDSPDSPSPTPDSLFPTPSQILDLKICDPAMGSGAFLVEACRQLGDELVKAWHVHGQVPKLPPDEDEILHARRLIAQRCLYGVDKNPMAVDLAKLSLWLATLAKDHPFTFLDHALRPGDSLVGLTQEQIAGFHWAPKKQRDLFREQIEKRLKAVTRFRQEILAARDDVFYEYLRSRLELADEQLALARLAGNVVVSAYFSADTDRKRQARLEELEAAMAAYLSPKGKMEDREPLARAEAELVGSREGSREWGVGNRGGEADGGGSSPSPTPYSLLPTPSSHSLLPTPLSPLLPFHWQIEFPEVFQRENGGFDAIVGNPPFAGKNTLINGNREGYLDWLKMIHEESHGNSDLVAHFFRRAFNLLRRDRCFGLIATNTIGQGDTRSTGLRWICTHGGNIYAARKRLKWPGMAAVVVSVVHVFHGAMEGPFKLDGHDVPIITAYLFHSGGHGDPESLQANRGKSFVGSYVLGMGFTFDDTNPDGAANPIAEMHRLIASDSRNADRILPYINGGEVNESPTHAPHRYVINFGQMTEEEARAWPDLMAIVEARVKPGRLAQNREARARYWWRFAETAPALYEAIRGKQRVLVRSLTSTNFPTFTYIPGRMVYDQTLIVFALDEWSSLAVMCSRIHESWAVFFGATMKDDPRYNVEDCFTTFPFPTELGTNSTTDHIGQAYYDFRAALMLRNNEGLTKTYNRFHDPSETSPDILKLRELHAAMDRAVLEAYGWHDLAETATCEFLLDYEDEEEDDEATASRRKKPWRYRWPDDFRDEVLARLLALNQQRAQEEALAGKTAKAAGETAKKRATRKPKADDRDRPLLK
jgi:hypothetical protein